MAEHVSEQQNNRQLYIGTEGNKEVFETESGAEIVLHKDDIDKLISKYAVYFMDRLELIQ